MRMKKLSMKKREMVYGLLFISPWLIGFLIFTLYPIISSLYYSLCDYKVISAPQFIGMENYAALFGDTVFVKALKNTAYMEIGRASCRERVFRAV